MTMKSYRLNDVCVVELDPDDPATAERIAATAKAIEGVLNANKRALTRTKDPRKLLEASKRVDGEVREMLDDVFGKSVCTPLFGSTSVLALADGTPLWANLLAAVMEEIENGRTPARAE